MQRLFPGPIPCLHLPAAILVGALVSTVPSSLFAQGASQQADTVPPTARASTPTGGIENPLLPRGSLEFAMTATTMAVPRLYGEGDGRPLGEGSFLLPELGPTQLPELESVQDRLRTLMGDAGNWSLNLGATAGRFEADEQVVRLRAGYGVLDRLSVGLTVPMVRRRLTSALTLAGTGATAGANPSETDAAEVGQFLSAADQALAELEAQVEQECAPESGSTSRRSIGSQTTDRCEEGQELMGRASEFVQALRLAYEEEIVFPLRESNGGDALLARWTDLRDGLVDWQVEGPEAPPLARSPLSPDAFISRFVTPVWGPDGFPVDSPQELMELGDVEAHVVVGLLNTGIGEGDGIGIQSSLLASARFATGTPDSVQTLVAHHPPGGVSGYGGRLVTNLTLPSRFGLLAVVEGWTFGEAETTILAPDPARVLGETAIARLPVRWSPGSALRIRVTPRVHVTPSLSVGLGYELDRRGEAGYAPTSAAESTDLSAWTTGSTTLQRVRAELRYHGVGDGMADLLPFPLELLVAYDATTSGDGPLAGVERRVQAGFRILRGR